MIALILLSYVLWQESIFGITNDMVSSGNSPLMIATAIFVLLALDVVLPTPSSLLSVYAAVYFGVLGGALLIFAGMSAGCFLGYYLGRTTSVAMSVGLKARVQQERVAHVWMEKMGVWSLSLARPVPVLAETTVVMAGIKQLPVRTFLAYTMPANALIALFYGLLGVVNPMLFNQM